MSRFCYQLYVNQHRYYNLSSGKYQVFLIEKSLRGVCKIFGIIVKYENMLTVPGTLIPLPPNPPYPPYQGGQGETKE